MEWQEILGSFVLIPKSPIAVIHFIGGAFIMGSAPNFTYRWLLEALAKQPRSSTEAAEVRYTQTEAASPSRTHTPTKSFQQINGRRRQAHRTQELST